MGQQLMWDANAIAGVIHRVLDIWFPPKKGRSRPTIKQADVPEGYIKVPKMRPEDPTMMLNVAPKDYDDEPDENDKGDE
jgi:hypothetical protein